MRQDILAAFFSQLAGPGSLAIGRRIHTSIEWSPMPALMIIRKNLGGVPNG
jgi:hypothetical protein